MIIFLDIDGVLCTRRSHLAGMQQGGMMESLDPIGIEMINYMCAVSKTPTYIVISSTWRILHPDLPMIFRMLGLRGAFHPKWKTPDAFNKDANRTLRGDDLNQWFDENGKDDYIILDDDEDFYDDQKERLIVTDFDNGISFENFKQAMLLLTDGNEQWWKLLGDNLPTGWLSAIKQKQKSGET